MAGIREHNKGINTIKTDITRRISGNSSYEEVNFDNNFQVYELSDEQVNEIPKY